MPMTDIYATAGTFSNVRRLAADAAPAVKDIEQVYPPGRGRLARRCGFVESL